MKKLLITGFDPFGGESVNPSFLAVERLPDTIGDYTLKKLQVPTVFSKAAQTVLSVNETYRADVILCVGQAGGRENVTPELVGINLRYASISDNEGNQPKDEAIVEGGENAYFTPLPVREMVQKMKEKGFPASVSTTAGTFVCNDLLYTLLYHYKNTDTRVGFIHVPFLPEQAKEGTASLPLEQTIGALVSAIEAL